MPDPHGMSKAIPMSHRNKCSRPLPISASASQRRRADRLFSARPGLEPNVRSRRISARKRTGRKPPFAAIRTAPLPAGPEARAGGLPGAVGITGREDGDIKRFSGMIPRRGQASRGEAGAASGTGGRTLPGRQGDERREPCGAGRRHRSGGDTWMDRASAAHRKAAAAAGGQEAADGGYVVAMAVSARGGMMGFASLNPPYSWTEAQTHRIQQQRTSVIR